MTTGHPARRMSSGAVRLGMLGALSVALTGCAGPGSGPGYSGDPGYGDGGESVQATCVRPDSLGRDGSYEVVDDDYCDGNRMRSGRAGGYYWYYGGRRAGRRVLGGSSVRPPGADIHSSSGRTVQRGGFGNRSHGGS
jgi:hypothetical protein